MQTDILIMASNDVVIVAEFLVGVSNEVIEVQEVQELATDTVMVEERVVEEDRSIMPYHD